MQLKKRRIKVTIGEVGLINTFDTLSTPKSTFDTPKQMRINFEVKKYANITAFGMNTASIELYNLSDPTSQGFIAKDLPVLIEAGWEGQENIIFYGRIGTALRIKKEPKSPDVITNLLCSAGLRNIRDYVVSRTIKKMEIKDFLISLCRNIKVIRNGVEINSEVEAIFIKDLNGNELQGIINERTFDDYLMTVLVKLSNEFNFDCQVEENNIIFRPREIKPTFEIKPENGLLGIPEITEFGIDLKTFLNPNLATGDAFTLSSRYSNFKLGALEFLDRTDVTGLFNSRKVNHNNRYEGTYQIVELTHKGSSHSNMWQSEITSRNYVLNQQTSRNR